MSEYVLELKGITKIFPGVKALNNVQFQLKPGEVHALMGENGAGKSTFIKVITGVHKAEEGEMFLNGQKVDFKGPKDAQAAGIAAVYQHPTSYPHLTVAENIFMGHEIIKNRMIQWKAMNTEANKLLKQLDADFDATAEMGTLSVAQQQMVEIAKAMSTNARIIILDEPTAALTRSESEKLYTLVDKLKADGVSIIFISHRFEDMYRLASRVTVFRDSQYIGTYDVDGITNADLIKAMVGREIKDLFPKPEVELGDEMLRIEHLSRTGFFKDVSFNVRAGEIVGLTGLVGAGRTEVVESVCGITNPDEGKVYLEGKEVHIEGIGYFYPTLAATGKVTRSTPHKTNKVAFKTVRFRPDSNLKGHFVGVRANQSKYVRHSEKVSEVEIDMLLKEYFAERQMMTRRDFQEVCGLARTTAKTHLVRLRGEGKLVNIGLRNQPMYVPAPGYYGVSRDAAHPSR